MSKDANIERIVVPRSEISDRGFGEFDVVDTSHLQDAELHEAPTTLIEEATPTPQQIEVVVRPEQAPSPRFERTKRYLGIAAAGAVVLAVVGPIIGNKITDAVKDVAPKKERTFDIDEFRQKVSAQSTVASGVIESTADVHSSYSYILGSAECHTDVSGTQIFQVAPKEDGSNIEFDDHRNQITVNLDNNVVTIGRQSVEMGDPDDCNANNIGSFFDDQQKAYATAAEKAPRELRQRTNIESGDELMSLENGLVGENIAASAASTYEAVAGSILEATNSDISIVYKYDDEVILPNRENQTAVSIDAGSINTDEQ